MAQYGFGSGILWGVQSSNAAGAAIANPTPVRFGVLQDVSIDLSFTNKELHGGSQFPLAIGRGQGKIQGKAKFGQVNGALVNSLFFGQTLTVGQSLVANGEAATVPAATPWQITVANATTFAENLGVRYSSTGLPLTVVASAPAVGQYTVSAAGLYTFSTGDANAAVLIDYRYTAASTGSQITISNQLMGYAPQFAADLLVPYGGKSMVLRLNACIGSKLSFMTKLDDFTIPEFDFEAFADSANNIGTISFSE